MFLEVMEIVGRWAQRRVELQLFEWWCNVDYVLEGIKRALRARMAMALQQ